ncbi:ABC-2 type transport system permease protein [Salinibacillus kushneri]|uniref:ABC-2 type transport system permease protein n=1 Tax=Salinibacillus kushneri TaxID=237682 RepID=A0A1H9YD43_9BACI|nr:hypothetical protein [Salinibacillus kushneri]SES66889.1 ABC-2 type transport system permease protein [Salinibacillus kushneri]
MLPKALLIKEWKHAKVIIWAILVVYLIQFPVFISMKMEEWKDYQYESFFQNRMDYEITSAFTGNFLIVISVGLIFILAGVLVGLERNSKRHDFSLALPYSKPSMFLTKTFLGLVSVLVSYVISFWIGYFMIWNSEFSYMLNELDLLSTFVAPFLAYFVLFTFAMFIGTIAGEMKSQVALSIIFLFFPVGVMYILSQFWEIHHLGHFDFPKEIMHVFWPTYLTGTTMEWVELLYPVMGGIIFFFAGLKLFERVPAEHSGQFLVFYGLHPVFKIGIPVCSALLGGFLLSGIVPYHASEGIHLIFYWIGALVALVFSWIITKRLLVRAS